MSVRHFLALKDFTPSELLKFLKLASQMKANPGDYRTALADKTLGMIFHKKSTRTRVSFEVGMTQLGGSAFYFGPDDLQLSRGEPISDTAKVLSRYLNAIMIRTFRHEDLLEFARNSTIPVINGLTDFNHPCQVLADLLTIQERFGGFPKKLAYVGDGNNMAHSLMMGCAKVGMSVSVVCPDGYRPLESAVKDAIEHRINKETSVTVTSDIREGVASADVVYTDVWASMGQEAESEARKRAFEGFQVNERLMNLAASHAIFMHCLPAHRGEEVAAEVIDGPQSLIFDQAENRLHAQKAVLFTLIKPDAAIAA